MQLDADVQKFAASVLRKYPLMKTELEQLQKQRNDVGIKTMQLDLPVSKRNSISDPTAKEAMRLLRLESRWRHLEFYVKAVEDILKLVNEERRRMIELVFFRELPLYMALNELAIGERTLYRWRKEVLTLLAHRLGL
jgi:RinA family phage transcriptional activator